MPTSDYVSETLSPDGRLGIQARGRAVLSNPMINRGTAFTAEERARLGLTGLLPSGVTTLDNQTRRVLEQYRRASTPLAKNLYLASLRDRNEVLFYRLLADNIEEMLPVVYTPTIGEAIERFSHEFGRTRGVFLSIDRPEDIEMSLTDYGLGPDDVDLLVATDSEGILGIGDQGIGGIQIAVGKLSVYTAAAGIHPRRAIPIVLDVGTDNLGLLNNDMYLGERHARVRGEKYDEFINTFVRTATRLFPHALLHWEDFGTANAHRILGKYRDDYCTFNDDIQGTAAVALAAILAAVNVTGVPLRDHRIVVYGAGTAGIGISNLIRDTLVRGGATEKQAYGQFYALGKEGLYVDDLPLLEFQTPYARKRSEVARWKVADQGYITLAEVMNQVQPTILIGTSTHGGAFTREIVQTMAATIERPIIMPMSNPTSRAEATPADLLAWTEGRALVATGSPFSPVDYDGIRYTIAQANNALVFPGLGLAVAACRASRVTEHMIAASAQALAKLTDAGRQGSSLLPSMSDLRPVSAAVAIEVARAAAEDGVARTPLVNPIQDIYSRMWQPVYPEFDAI